MIKYKVHEVSKDLGVSSKEVIEVVKKYCGKAKKSMTALEEDELNVVFDYFTQKNNMESYAPLVKVWTARDMLNEATGRECTQNEIANYTNINLQMVKKCDNILKSNGMYKIEPIYETLVFVDEDGTEHSRTHKKGTKAIMNAFYNESITDEKKNELQTQIALPFNKFVGN